MPPASLELLMKIMARFIQRAWRKRCARRQQARKRWSTALLVLQSALLLWVWRRRRRRTARLSAARRIQRWVRKVLSVRKWASLLNDVLRQQLSALASLDVDLTSKLAEMDRKVEEKAAIKMEAGVRGMLVRSDRFKTVGAIIRIQFWLRRRRRRQKKREVMLRQKREVVEKKGDQQTIEVEEEEPAPAPAAIIIKAEPQQAETPRARKKKTPKAWTPLPPKPPTPLKRPRLKGIFLTVVRKGAVVGVGAKGDLRNQVTEEMKVVDPATREAARLAAREAAKRAAAEKAAREAEAEASAAANAPPPS